MPSDRPNLENLARAKQLNAEPAHAPEIEAMLARAATLIADARNMRNSVESRFTLAYSATHLLALAALRNAGYRPGSAGHRRIVFQVLEFTADAPQRVSLALAQHHDRRNRHEYEGGTVTSLEAKDILQLAEELNALVAKRVKASKPSGR